MFSEEELEEIEKQLSCPEGENGLTMADNMNESNLSMTLASIETLDLKSGEHILEIGHGNCDHLKYIHEKADNLEYVGLEISETMQAEARRINSKYNSKFLLYNGETLPFTEASFDKIFTVNTIYFWKDAVDLLKQIKKILKVGGTFVLTFALKSFMQNLPFVNSKFELFDEKDIRKLISHSNLKIEELNVTSEVVTSKSLDKVKRDFAVVKIKKHTSEY